jgi:uncharacterized membrane protein YqgA involved in biofilm formation
LFSAFSVLIYQGLLTVFAEAIQPLLSPTTIIELKALGGVLIFAIGINLLGMARIPLSNMTPALIVVVPVAALFA